MMKFIVDTQLPPRLAHYITSVGYQTVHTTFYENGHLLDDNTIVVIAKEEDRTIITKDSDFLDNYVIHGAPPKVLVLEFGNISNKDLLKLFDDYFNEVIISFEQGNNIVLFRRDEIIGY